MYRVTWSLLLSLDLFSDKNITENVYERMCANYYKKKNSN